MVMKTLVFILALAQLPPLPSLLMTAQTATLVNGGVNQDEFDRTSLELQKWGRYRLIEEGGEIQIVVTRETQHASPMMSYVAGMPIALSLLRLTFKDGETILYSDQVRGWKQTLQKLQKRLNQ